ncbi:hypothetical protein DAMA08_019970 [Martiniozyma asiatica (nom. inval.)]|nr:hypothetical protein DAMA08_019970 [Martiniozyma asiatica]
MAANSENAFRSTENANRASQINKADDAAGMFNVPWNIERSFAALRRKMNNFIKRQEFRNLVDNNERRHMLNLQCLPIPFIVGEMLGDLSVITDTVEVMELNRNQIEQYLTGYDVAFGPDDDDARLRQLLMISSG